MELALGILGTILGVAALGLSIYNTIILKSELRLLSRPDEISPRQSRETVRNIYRGEPDDIPAHRDNLGMPEVYDPEEDYPSIDNLGM